MSREKENPLHSDGNQNIANVAINAVLSMLPLHAEEGGRREIVAECELVGIIATQGVPIDTISALIYALRRQFEALALLDLMELKKGNWAFVSFPASLFGRAWLITLATPGQALLPPNYWEQGEHRPDESKEEQRALLHRMETERLRLNPQAQPIRTVHVAWALLRWGDKFLLHRREDKARPGEKGYGMVGGRFNLNDLPPAQQSRQDILREIFNLDSVIVASHITATLERELTEETGMLIGKHYTCAPFRQPLPPYQEVNGAGNRHAYSVYRFHLFQVKLTPAGETHLLAKVAGDERLTWFTAAEIAASQRADGAAAYVDALRHAWGENLENNLSSVPFSVRSPKFTGESMMLDLPGAPDAVFRIGKPGKEKALFPGKMLTQEEWQLLMLLGWHTRGFRVDLAADVGARLLGNGWMDAPMLVPLARGLLDKVQPVLPGLVEIREDRFVSLNAAPEVLFWAADLFRYQTQGSNSAGGVFRINRSELETPWGRLSDGNYVRSINGNTVATLRGLEKGDEPAGDWERTLRDQLGEGVKAVGIRRLWSTKGNVTSLVEGLTKTTAASSA
jgi:8-oxo-dGTP pyrophosphatase MutT (NUDIX family)